MNQEGGYEVNLFWKRDYALLPNNLELANKSLVFIYKRLQNYGCLDNYNKVGSLSITLTCCSTKVQPVFDASVQNMQVQV